MHIHTQQGKVTEMYFVRYAVAFLAFTVTALFMKNTCFCFLFSLVTIRCIKHI